MKTNFTFPENHILCTICKDPNKPLTDAEFQAEEVQHTKDGLAHADCYYAEIGAEIDAHPICSPRVHRG